MATEWEYGLKDEEVTPERILTDLRPFVDESGQLDEDRTNAPMHFLELIDHLGLMDREFADLAIARVVRTAAALVRRFPDPEDDPSSIFYCPPGCAWELAMVWEFG